MSDNQRIQPLPLHLANQIAAGEVIERPASVVKELIENSIDANATEIVIDIEGAGSHLIRVRDNGSGIHQDDLSLALSRHATSKLYTSEQLSHISSLGFRGEALPSVSSVSKLTLSSRQEDSDCGWQYSESNHSLTPVSHPLGTTIEVRELFFNLPARKHFLRGDKTEQNHITTTLYRLALSQFEISFNYHPSATTQIKLPAAKTRAQQQQRIAKICGKQFIDHSLYLQQDYDDVALSGWVASSEGHRPQTDVNYFFINGRVIRDRVINHAIRQAYDGLIPSGRYPAFVLYLTMPLDRVDINVHPTKHEVRFRDARLIHGLITSAVREAITSEAEELVESQPSLELATQAPTETVKASPSSTVAEQPNHYQPKPVSHRRTTSTPPAQTNSSSFSVSGSALINQRYIISQYDNESWLIDLQVADTTLRTQQLQQALTTNTLRSRPILVPISIAVSAESLNCIESNIALLEQLAIDVTINANSKKITVKSIPTLLTQISIPVLIEALAEQLLAGNNDMQQLGNSLINLLPKTVVNSLQQAETILQQLAEPNQTQSWCRQLDQETLSSLF